MQILLKMKYDLRSKKFLCYGELTQEFIFPPVSDHIRSFSGTSYPPIAKSNEGKGWVIFSKKFWNYKQQPISKSI